MQNLVVGFDLASQFNSTLDTWKQGKGKCKDPAGGVVSNSLWSPWGFPSCTFQVMFFAPSLHAVDTIVYSKHTATCMSSQLPGKVPRAHGERWVRRAWAQSRWMNQQQSTRSQRWRPWAKPCLLIQGPLSSPLGYTASVTRRLTCVFMLVRGITRCNSPFRPSLTFSLAKVLAAIACNGKSWPYHRRAQGHDSSDPACEPRSCLLGRAWGWMY